MVANYRDKKVVIMGLGSLGGGVGAARFFAQNGARVLVTDIRGKSDLTHSISQLSSWRIEYVLGQHRHDDFSSADLIIRNPSVRSDSAYLQTARDHGVPIEMSESLFMKLSPTSNIIGVTGTRGKSTTSAMIYEALKQSGKHTVLGGNVRGVSTLALLEGLTKDSWVVLELSSWQLQSFGWYRISPPIAAVTNMYPDHLNYYQTMDDYAADKKNIFLFQKKGDVTILNSLNKYTHAFASEVPSKYVWFDDAGWPADVPLTVLGAHNRENAACALSVCTCIGIDRQTAIHAIATFPGLPGRLQFVRERNGIRYINDTTSTTPIAGVKALEALPEGRIVLIAGGNTKNIPLDPFIAAIQKRVRYTVLFSGSAANAFSTLKNVSTPIAIGDMKKAVEEATNHARSGDTILFSPGVTHLPLRNEFERGDDFDREVKAL